MQKFSWYRSRLKAMPAKEVAYRAVGVFRAEKEIRFPPQKCRLACFDPSRTGVPSTMPRFYFDSEDIEALRPQLDVWVPEIQSMADRFCDHHYIFFGLEFAYPEGRLNWHQDPIHGIEAPRQPAHRLDYRDVNLIGEAKFIWEPNRHQHLPLLALASLLTDDDRYANEVLEQITQWIRENPYRIGINWTSALEAALRLISWSWVFFLLKEGDRDLPNAFFQSLGEHCHFVRTSLSFYSSRGNHLVGEASGLFVASLLFARDPFRSQWIRKAYEILTSEIESQVYPDGVSKELSTGYHRFLMELFLLPALLGRMNGIDFPRTYWTRLKTMGTFLSEMRDCAGWQPHLGDNDDSRVLDLGGFSSNSTDSLLTTGAVLFEEPDILTDLDRPDIRSLFLLGRETPIRIEELKRRKKKSPVASISFPQSGYSILRHSDETQREIFLTFDCGPTGMEPMAGHGHADALSFTLSLDGIPFFVDPGTYTYRTDDPWRAYFRGTSAHNTVRIDEEDQSVPGGGFLWTRKAKGTLEAWEPAGNAPRVKGSHDGYTRYRDPVLHAREIRMELGEGSIVILDEIKCRLSHKVEIYFHLHPDCRVRKEKGDPAYWLENHKREIRLLPDSCMDFRVAQGETNPILGWYSPGYGLRKPAVALRGVHTAKGTKAYVSRILLAC